MGVAMDFLQMRGRYSVKGTAAAQDITFESAGSAENFPRPLTSPRPLGREHLRSAAWRR